MAKPIWYIFAEVLYNKTLHSFYFSTTAENKEELSEYDKMTIVSNITSSKEIRTKYKDIYPKCQIINLKKIKQIGYTN